MQQRDLWRMRGSHVDCLLRVPRDADHAAVVELGQDVGDELLAARRVGDEDGECAG
jgi:hypothetical protein